MKRKYITPTIEIIYMYPLLRMPGASQFDNDHDGIVDQEPVIIGDPDEIGAKEINIWDNWDDE
jgi:hypothetical protein